MLGRWFNVGKLPLILRLFMADLLTLETRGLATRGQTPGNLRQMFEIVAINAIMPRLSENKATFIRSS